MSHQLELFGELHLERLMTRAKALGGVVMPEYDTQGRFARWRVADRVRAEKAYLDEAGGAFTQAREGWLA